MKPLRALLSVLLSMTLVALAPGLSAYQAVAATFTAPKIQTQGNVGGGAVGAAGSIRTSGAVTLTPLSLQNVSGSLQSHGIAPQLGAGLTAAPAALVPAIETSILTPQAAPAALESQTLGAPDAQAPPTAFSALSQAMPEFGKMEAGQSKTSAGADFLRRIGLYREKASADASVPGALNSKTAPLSRARAADARSSAPLPAPKSERVAPRGVGKALFAAAAGGVLSGFAFSNIVTTLTVYPLIIVSLILHEMGHAKAAERLGDPTARLQGRLSFKPKDLLTHIDPVWTVLVPLVTMVTSGFIIGGAKPVPVDTYNFRDPAKDMSKVALAGPAVNFALALVGAAATFAIAATGVAAAAAPIAATFTMINVMLGIFNLVPVSPLDGSHVLRHLLPAQASAALDRLYAKAGWFPLIAVVLLLGGSIAAATTFITHLLLTGAAYGAAQLAGAALPAMAGLGLMLGQVKSAAPPSLTPGGVILAQTVAADKPVDYIVVLDGAAAPVSQDLHLAWIDEQSPSYVSLYARGQQNLLAQLRSAGLASETLARYNATPVASYKRINAATLRVDAAKAAEFRALLTAQGFKVYDNSRREIIRPVPVDPETADPAARGAVTMQENLKITKADAVQAVARAQWGAPERGFGARLAAKLTGMVIPQPAIGVIDTGVDLKHPQLKRVKGSVNATSGPNVDDNGHGSWVTSMVLNYAPWLKSVTHYKTFVDGGANLDDILKALTLAGNDGNLVISNSWGSDEGDPKSPDSELVRKLAEEGHVMVFAAGNAGPGANTIGSPAIVTYKDAKTGAIRVLSVAASDRNKKVASFSSRGPGSPITQKIPDYAHRPDLMGVGYNTDGAWPTDVRGADRVDPELGPLKAISGTSMSTPSIAGAIALLAMMFGVTAKGEKLDAVVNAVMSTLEKTGQSRDVEGEGFINVQAAYEALKAAIEPVRPNFLARFVQRILP